MPAEDLRRPERRAVRAGAMGVRTVAIFEGAKGLIVLVAGFGLLSLIHRDVQAVAESVIRDAAKAPTTAPAQGQTQTLRAGFHGIRP